MQFKINRNYVLFVLLIGIFLLLNVLGIFRTVWGINTAIFLTIIGGYKIFYDAIAGIFHGRLSLGFIVFIAAIAALLVKEYIAAAEVIFIMLVGEGLEKYVVGRTRSAIQGLVDLTPQTARRKQNGKEEQIPISEVNEDDIIIVRPGERIPVDGIVAAGQSTVNQATITGESIAVEKEPQDEVFSGTINELGALEIKTTKVGEDTLLSKIIHLVEEAQEHKAPVQRTADKFARYFVPIVLVIAAGTYFFTGDIIRAVSIIIVACPCALILATPAAVAAGIGRLASEGILVKGGEFLEALGKITRVAFDKTGTVTTGKPKITQIIPFFSYSDNDVLELAAAAEEQSTHLLADLIVSEAHTRNLSCPKGKDFTLIPGRGVSININDEKIHVGNLKLLAENEIPLPSKAEETLNDLHRKGRTSVLVAKGTELAGIIAAEDRIRPEAESAVSNIKGQGIHHVYLLTGDNERVAKQVARRIGIDHYHANLLPDEKVSMIREIQHGDGGVAMMGDGINDAPSLATADVGIAMGGIGTDITMEAADVVIMDDDLGKLETAIDFGRRTLITIRKNIIYFAIILNLAAISGAALGYITPVLAAVVHQLGSILVILNSARLLTVGKFRNTALGYWLHQRAHYFKELIHKVKHLERGDVAQEFSTRKSFYFYRIVIPLFVLYFFTGFYKIDPAETGLKIRFGKLVNDNITPGLHYRIPWPVGQIVRIEKNMARRIEIGFRTSDEPESTVEPAAYEWSLQHRVGYQKQEEESLILTGDENILEINLVIQYAISDAAAYLFNIEDPENLVRLKGESILKFIIGRISMDNILTTDRLLIEHDMKNILQRVLDDHNAGIIIERVNLQDLHPPVEVVDAFREVASALEDKDKLINEAEAYRNEEIPIARGSAQKSLLEANAYSVEKVNKAVGESDKFLLIYDKYRRAPQINQSRMYLETIEQVLPAMEKFIFDQKSLGNRQILLWEGAENLSVPQTIIQAPEPYPQEEIWEQEPSIE